MWWLSGHGSLTPPLEKRGWSFFEYSLFVLVESFFELMAVAQIKVRLSNVRVFLEAESAVALALALSNFHSS